MTTYVWNKIISLLLPMLVIGVISLLVAVPQSWTVLLVGISLLGYTHYVLGACYQHKAWLRRSNYWQFFGWSFLFATLSIVVVAFAVAQQLLWLVALLTIPYFVWHGYENELTLFLRTTVQMLSPVLIAGISLVAVGATLDAFRHTSAGFTATLSYYTATLVPPTKAMVIALAPYLFWAGLIGMVSGIALLSWYLYRTRTKAALWWCGVAFGLLAWFWYANPLPYVWFFVLLLGYHFVTWGVHYGVVFWSDNKRFYRYLFGHVLVVGGVLVVSVLLIQVTDRFPLGLLNNELFLAATLIHISTSFLNDSWLQQRLGLLVV